MICKQASLQQSKAPRKHDGQHQCTYGAKIGCFEALVVGAFSTRGYAYRVSKYRSWGAVGDIVHSSSAWEGGEDNKDAMRCHDALGGAVARRSRKRPPLGVRAGIHRCGIFAHPPPQTESGLNTASAATRPRARDWT